MFRQALNPSLMKLLFTRNYSGPALAIGVAASLLVGGFAFLFLPRPFYFPIYYGVPLFLGCMTFYLLLMDEGSWVAFAFRVIATIGVWVLSFLGTGLAYLADPPAGQSQFDLALALSPIYIATGLLTGVLLPRLWFLVVIPAFAPLVRGDLVNVAALFVGSGLVALLFWRFKHGRNRREVGSQADTTDLEHLSREEKCIHQLKELGYRVVSRNDAWIVHEPLGGRVKIDSLDGLEEYAQSK